MTTMNSLIFLHVFAETLGGVRQETSGTSEVGLFAWEKVIDTNNTRPTPGY